MSDRADGKSQRSGRNGSSRGPVARCDGTPVARRGVVLAAAVSGAALIPQALHGAEDVRAGIGPAPALVVLLAVQLVAIVAALTGRRWGVRIVLAVAVGWVIGALFDHVLVFTDPAGFRDGWSSTLAVFALIALNTASAMLALAPSMPARWDALKTPVADAWPAVDHSDTIVLDVRTPRERAGGMIPGAVVASWRHPVGPGDGREVLVVCSHGARALSAARTLGDRGIDARSLSGGMSAYRREGLPLDRES